MPRNDKSSLPALVPFTIKKPPSLNPNNRAIVWSCYFCKTRYVDIFDDKLSIDQEFKCAHCTN